MDQNATNIIGFIKEEIESDENAECNLAQDDEDESMPLQSFVIKEEPKEMDTENDSLTLDPSVVVKLEPNFDDEFSSDDDKPLKKPKKKKRIKKVENFIIKCVLCGYNTNVKHNYKNHVYRTHKGQQLQCDGCDKSYHFIYRLLEHRKSEHGFTYEYRAAPTVPTKENKSEEEISCPLCNYKSNIKLNYQKHVVRLHKRQELQCEECDFKHHFIYTLERHRREKHNLYTPYVADESLKLKEIYERSKSKIDRNLNRTKMINKESENDQIESKERKIDSEFSSDDDNEVEDFEIECPFCDFKSNDKNTYQEHSLVVHNRQNVICDGCDKTTHLIYLLLKHRKIVHGFTHEYSAVAVPLQETKSEPNQEEEEISCPLCPYKSNVKDNYQKHVNRIHNRQKLQCEKCDYSHHLIYTLEEHRREKHNLDTQYEVDESYKLKTWDKRFKNYKDLKKSEIQSENDSNETSKIQQDSIIKCPLCDFESNMKVSYQKHTLRVHNRQEMICDGCDTSSHLIYLLLEHRKIEHGFTYDYKVNTKPMPPIQPDSKEEEKEISCPLCHYKSNTKMNYQKHVIRSHNKEKLQCEKCDYNHHLIYYLEEHRREKHDLNTPYKTKKLTFDLILNGDSSELTYECPLCPYKSKNRTRFTVHYRVVHRNLEMPCDGCTTKFNLYHRLLQHRKLKHNNYHSYVVPESVVIENNNYQKTKIRVKKSPQTLNYPCPKCDCRYTKKRDVVQHLRIFHKYDKNPKMEVIIKERGNGKIIIEEYPEQRDPYICHYCEHPEDTKCLLLEHMYKIHNLPVDII